MNEQGIKKILHNKWTVYISITVLVQLVCTYTCNMDPQ